MNGISLLT
jgi:hypothetical protein